MISLYKNIKKRRRELGLTQEQLARKLNYRDKSTIAKIESGKSDLPQSKISEFAKALETTPTILMGWEMPNTVAAKALFAKVYDIVYSGIPFSELLAIDEIIISKKLLSSNAEFIALKVKDDSMYPEYLVGDTVLIKLQDCCSDDDDCAVFSNNDIAVIKRIQKSDDSITLKPLNTNYLPVTHKLEDVKILGKVIEIRREKE